MKSVLYIGYRDNLHSSVGGYDHITENPNSSKLMGEDVLFGNIPVNTRGKFLNILVLDLLMRIKRHKFDVAHMFYGDTLMLPYLRTKHNKLVATLHMSLDAPRKNRFLFFYTLKRLDGVVVLSSSQQRLLLEKYGIDSVFIPHGFSLPKFHKVNNLVDKNYINIVVLGQNYRDYDCLLESLAFCSVYCPKIRFHFIGQPKWFKEKIQRFSNAIIYPRLSDNDYFSIIDDSDYNFLPVTFATANNALLEAQFLGIVSILPRIDGIEDYSSPLNTFYKDKSELFQLFLTCSKSKKNTQIVEYCKKFSWDNIYKQLNEFYDSLF